VAGYTARARAILEYQAAMGIEPLAVTSVRQGPCPRDLETIDGVDHYRTPAPALLFTGRLGAAPVVRESMEMAALGRHILQIHRARRVDVIHAHSPVLCGLPALAAARRLGLPSVYEIRAFWEDAAESQGKGGAASARYAAIRGMETSLCRSVDSVVALCEGIRRDLAARGIPARKIFVVPNGVDTERFAPRRASPELASRLGLGDGLVIAYIGTLFRFEGIDLLLRALARMIAVSDQVRGLIVGYGEAEAELRALRERLGLVDRVVFTGKVAPGEVGDLYALASIVCYPRERQRITELTTPLKPLEAMSMGKAVVASDVGGLTELVRDRETGLLFRAGDEDDLVRALTRAARDADLRAALGERARAAMIAERAWPALARRYLAIYEAARTENARRLRDRIAAAT
jgi:PEP-CTERM/exosortase A-associated glycosyltransferase